MTAIVGLTGGIGSGKTTVAGIFEDLGFEVYYADDRARYLQDNSEEIRKAIQQEFGEELYRNGSLDRKKLGSIVFSDKNKLEKLNSIVHPATAQDFKNWFEKVSAHTSKTFVLKEAAILFESGSYKNCNAVLCISAPEEVRIQRVIKRDSSSREEVEERMKNQWPEERKRELSDFIIENDGNRPLLPQVRDAINFFKLKFTNEGS